MGWYTYKTADNKPILLDDVTMDNNPNELDNDKLPVELNNQLRPGDEMRFKWDKDLQEYVLKLRR